MFTILSESLANTGNIYPELSHLGVVTTPALLYELENICVIDIAYSSHKEVTLPVCYVNPRSTATGYSSYINGYPLCLVSSFQLYYDAAENCSIRPRDFPIPN